MKIFLAVGTQKFPFDRLLRMVDEMAGAHEGEVSVFGQLGPSAYEPKHIQGKPFLSREEFDAAISGCDLLITHGGVNTIITSLKLEKKIITVPRLARYGEHVDDHQEQICHSFEEVGFALCYREGDDLWEDVGKAMANTYKPYVSHRLNMISTIEEYLEKVL